MTHSDAGHYAAKHPSGSKSDPNVVEKLKQKISDNTITCAAAHRVATDLSIEPKEVGMAIDLMEARIGKCQLGLFGYSPQKRIIKASESVPDILKAALNASLQDGHISCLQCWNIAKDQNLRKIEVANACEALGTKIKPCQLGAF